MTVRWRYLDGEGREAGGSGRFDSREAAEAWLGETWEELLAGGTEQVDLVNEDGDVLYTMALGEG